MDVALFDFDGTIADSGPTIMDSAAEALTRLGLPVPDEQHLRGFVGPPLMSGIVDVLGVPTAAAEDFRALYRSIYVGRMTEAGVFPGVADLLSDLTAGGHVLGVASSKREDLVGRILTAQGLTRFFRVVAGADPFERNGSKSWVVGRALGLLAERGVDASSAVLVGDRHHDVEGASHHGLRSIFVTWRYGVPEEAAGAWAVADTPADVARLLRA